MPQAQWLLQNGSSLTECDNDGYTSLILAACGGNIELVRFLLQQGSSLDDRNNNGDSALLLAAYCSHRDLVDWLLQNGSALAETNKTGMGVLISAANGGNCEVVELLLQRISENGAACGDGIEHTDEGGYTPLLLAAQRGHIDVVRLLVSYGADTHARTSRCGNVDMISGPFLPHFSAPTHPHKRRGICSTWCACRSDAEWQSDVVPDSRFFLNSRFTS